MMNTTEKTIITVRTTINAHVEKVWNLWTDPKHIIRWYFASDDWHAPKAENELRVGGRFLTRMEARDGSSGFDFTGRYSKVETNRQIEYIIDDGRNVQVLFVSNGNTTTVMEAFEAELTNPAEMQQAGWQTILDNFRAYVEGSVKHETMHFEVTINAIPAKVYQVMLDDEKYTEWTSVFNPSSHFMGSWEKDSKIVFLGTDQDGTSAGMVSRIRENIPDRFLSIEHLGIVRMGKEILSGPEVDQWAGALENYTFTEYNGGTLLRIDMDVNQDHKAYFAETWPSALGKLKEICEK